MLQNAQMHQLVMQQMMLSSLPHHQQRQQQDLVPSHPPSVPVNRPNAAQLRQLLAVRTVFTARQHSLLCRALYVRLSFCLS